MLYCFDRLKIEDVGCVPPVVIMMCWCNFSLFVNVLQVNSQAVTAGAIRLGKQWIHWAGKKKGLTVKTDITWAAVISPGSLWPRRAWWGLKLSYPPPHPEPLINSSVLCCIGCVIHWCIIYESVQTCSTWYERELNAEWLSIWLPS